MLFLISALQEVIMNSPAPNPHVLNRIESSGPKNILACDGGGMLGLMSVENSWRNWKISCG
jgi:hypothetical protein